MVIMYVFANNKGIATQEARLFSGTRLQILKFLARAPSYPKEISRRLGINEQQIYYHVREMERQGLVHVAAREDRGGAAAKIYALNAPSFFVRFDDWKKLKRAPKSSKFLSPFVVNGNMNSLVVTGSPDPHGPERARSRDINYAVDLALFLGTFLTSYEKPVVVLDTELRRRDMKQNLIVVGGPVTNSAAKKINKSMPLRFDERKNIFSAKTKKTYRSNDAGLIAKAPNPLDDSSHILYIAGKRYSGTKAAILAFLTRFDEIEKKNMHVAQGFDMDGDGEVDEVKIVE